MCIKARHHVGSGVPQASILELSFMVPIGTKTVNCGNGWFGFRFFKCQSFPSVTVSTRSKIFSIEHHASRYFVLSCALVRTSLSPSSVHGRRHREV